MADPTAKQTSAIQGVMALAQKEFLTIHAICDKAMVATHYNGEKLSAAQRVAALAEALSMVAGNVGKVPSH